MASWITDSHRLEGKEVLSKLQVDSAVGLGPAEVEKRQAVYGRNELPHEEGTPFWKLVLKQFDDLLVKILLGAAFISFALAWFEAGDEQITAFIEPLVIFVILVANATVGVLQETNAEKAIEALKEYEPETAIVIRDGKHQEIPAVELVPGDIVEVAVGGRVPADIRIITRDSITLKADQSLLTGESESVDKHAEAIPDPTGNAINQEKKNLLFSGTTITRGKCRGVVVLTGLQTAMGKIRTEMVESEEVITPLKKKLDEFGELLSKVIGVICILVWLVNINHFSDPSHGSWIRGAMYYFKIAVALAVAAIPEGLPAVVTTCLALGTRKMAKRNAIVRSLPSVESLGCTTVICSDKTGTLTTNMMSVAKVVVISAESQPVLFSVSGSSWDPNGVFTTEDGAVFSNPAVNSQSLASLASVASLCNDSQINWNPEKKIFEKIGEPTEAALRVLVEKIGLPNAKENQALAAMGPADRVQACNNYWGSVFSKKLTFDFDRDRKSMSVLCHATSAAGVSDGASSSSGPVTRSKSKSSQSEDTTLFVKGQAQGILKRSTHVRLDNGEIVPMSDAIRQRITKVHDEFTGVEALRVLGLAVRRSPPGPEQLSYDDPANFVKMEQELTFIGMVGIIDPPRAEVKDAIKTCHEAGIRVIVITGDTKNTAEAICRKIGVFTETEDLKGKSFTGKEFDLHPNKDEVMAHASLFAETEPSHKSKLVDYLQKQKHVVAMTGDGVNDAPALRKADIGLAMGSGTAVAKSAAEMVLADDNFATIVAAVEEGRSIYNNTKQFIRYLISSNIGEVVCIFFTAVTGMPEALIPVQLLWVNLVTDGLPATALSFNPAETGIMKQRPRSSTEPIVNGWMFFRYLVIGVYVGLATVAGFIWWFTMYTNGPLLSWAQLTTHSKCDATWVFANGFDCHVFENPRPSTVSLSILVTVEMFNAMNSVSENQSILSMTPFVNPTLIVAILGSFILHFALLYVPLMARMFSVSPINQDEWIAVVAISAPVILVDELLKLQARIRARLNAPRIKQD